MSVDAPELSVDDLRAEIQKHRKGLAPILLLAKARPGEIDVELDGVWTRWQIATATCELALRQELTGRGDRPLVVALDFAANLPLDIESRIAQNRVHVPDRAARLVRLLCPNAPIRLEVSSELLRSAVGKALLAGAPARTVALYGSTMGVDTAWRAFLAAAAGYPLDGPMSLDRLLEFAASAQPKAGLASTFGRFANLRAEFETWLTGTVGASAVQLWRAWESGRGLAAAAVAVLLEAMAYGQLTGDPYLRGWLAAPLQEAGLGSVHPDELRNWPEAAATLMNRQNGTPLAQQIADAADRLIVADQARQTLGRASRFLPSAFAVLLGALAAAVDDTRTQRSRHSLELAGKLWRQLQNHTFARDERHQAVLLRSEFALRLLRWLMTEVPHPVGPAHEQAGQWAAWFAKEGGFVDLARRKLRAPGQGELDQALARLIAEVDARRDAMDLQFAATATAWQAAGRPLGDGLPIERALDFLGAHFLRGHADRRLMVLVLDGASWSVAVELLLDMQSREWAPLRWRPPQYGGATAYAVLADLPTLTDVSRAALFAGSRIPKGPKAPTSKDVERFSHHPSLAAIATRAGGPQLLLKGELLNSHGGLSDRASRLIASEDRVMACVLNAIDDDLGGAIEVRSSYSIESVPLLGQLLQGAFAASRAVLLIADHGHAPGDRMDYLPTPSTEGGGRWRAVPAGGTLQHGEFELSTQHAWGPALCERIALLGQETKRYSRAAASGDHGGISLAEMVAPAVLLGDGELESRAASTGDDDLAMQAPFVPSWWRHELDDAAAALPPALRPQPSRQAKPRAKSTESQLPFAAGVLPEPRSTLARPERPKLVAQVAESAVLQALPEHQRKTLHDKVLPWLEVLIIAGGRMSVDRFAQATGLLPSRVPGAASTMGELLGLDGYQPVSFDSTAQQLSVQEDVLRQLFVEG